MIKIYCDGRVTIIEGNYLPTNNEKLEMKEILERNINCLINEFEVKTKIKIRSIEYSRKSNAITEDSLPIIKINIGLKPRTLMGREE